MAHFVLGARKLLTLGNSLNCHTLVLYPKGPTRALGTWWTFSKLLNYIKCPLY